MDRTANQVDRRLDPAGLILTVRMDHRATASLADRCWMAAWDDRDPNRRMVPRGQAWMALMAGREWRVATESQGESDRKVQLVQGLKAWMGGRASTVVTDCQGVFCPTAHLTQALKGVRDDCLRWERRGRNRIRFQYSENHRDRFPQCLPLQGILLRLVEKT